MFARLNRGPVLLKELSENQSALAILEILQFLLKEADHRKWRNCLRKGEELGVTVTRHECKDDVLELLIESSGGPSRVIGNYRTWRLFNIFYWFDK